MDRNKPLKTVFFDIAWFCQEITKNPIERNKNGKRAVSGIQEVEKMKGIGQDFDDFMIEQGLYDEAKELSVKKLIVLELKQEMDAQKLSKSKIAEKMHTSRVAVDNILNPDYNTSIGTLERFASVLGKKLSISIS